MRRFQIQRNTGNTSLHRTVNRPGSQRQGPRIPIANEYYLPLGGDIEVIESLIIRSSEFVEVASPDILVLV